MASIASGALSSAPLSPGTIVAARYRLVRRLGEGGMGLVYRADDLQLDQPVALKFLAPEWSGHAELRRLFLAEVRFARRVSHPNVCRVYDVGESEGRLFLSMELVEGEDLASRLERSGPPSQGEALGLALGICRGLAAIHDCGLLHRDLKPSNVMIDLRGEARLSDLGLAASASAAGGGEGPDGTLDYLAPERLAGAPASLRSDLYSLGLVLAELFAGSRVYPRYPLVEIARRIRAGGEESASAEELPPPELDLPPNLDPEVARVVRWCLATEPRQRPASAEAVAAALQPDGGQGPGTFLRTLVAADPASLAPGGAAIGELLAEHGGLEVGSAAGRLWLFERPWAAVHFTLAGRLAPATGAALARVAIHLGEVILERQGPGQLTASGLEVERVWRLAALARPGQTLLSSHAFDLARHRSAGEAAPAGALRWLSHGSYRLAADEPPAEIFEVGVEGAAPLLAPESAEILLPAARELVAGWRPAPGVEIPQRPGWVIERKLGKGGFGDVWLTYHALSREARVFKFCYDLERLRSLQREITVFRLLKEHLGTRSDITRVIDWCFDEAPYFVEAEYTPEGSLADWARAQGGLGRISLALRLELMAQVATALAAAHSVGVLHKDVKPANVLIAGGEGGEVRAQLADFGIATVTDLGLLAAAGITALGLTETAASGSQTSPGGTRLYQAPELLEGKVPTLKADIFALGVLLYQMVVGDFSRALGSGWGRDIEDELLREDVAEAVDGSPDRRLGDAAQLAERLRTLPARRLARQAEAERQRRAARSRRQRQAMASALVVLVGLAVVVSALAWRIARESERAEKEGQAAARVADFLVSLFELSDPFAEAPLPGQDREFTARDILDQGAQRLDHELTDQPQARARLMNTIGRVYQRLGLYPSAQVEFEKALALRRQTSGTSHPDVEESLHDLGWLLHVEGEDERAEAILRELLARRRASLGPEHLYVANTLHDLAWVAQARGDLEEAERLAREALAVKRRRLPAAHPAIAASLNLLAFVLQKRGDLTGAEKFAREAVAMTRRLWGEHPDVAESLNNLARVLLAEGDAQAAEDPAREALAMRRRFLGGEHPAVAQSLHDLGAVLAAKGDYPGAEALFAESQALYTRLLGADHPGVAMNRESLAALRAKRSRAPTAESPALGSRAGEHP